MCRVVLENTNWDIRLLSKSNLLPLIAKGIPEEHAQRMIYGVSTGTLDDELGKFEKGTALISKRIQSLRKLQDMGLRTFGMICPVLPQRDYDAFAEMLADTICIDRCEHVWGEVFNPRGGALKSTQSSLVGLGFDWEAQELGRLTDNEAWEDYARNVFTAMRKVVPDDKLRFLQYVQKEHLEWWQQHVGKGAVLLGTHAYGT